MLLCGADMVESLAVPGVWQPEHVRTILGDYGVICISRWSPSCWMRRCKAGINEHARRGLPYRLQNCHMMFAGCKPIFFSLVNRIQESSVAMCKHSGAQPSA